jgi:hypothetical protein
VGVSSERPNIGKYAMPTAKINHAVSHSQTNDRIRREPWLGPDDDDGAAGALVPVG